MLQQAFPYDINGVGAATGADECWLYNPQSVNDTEAVYLTPK